MDFEKLRSDPRVAYLLGVGIGVALGLVIAARLRPQPTLWEKAQQMRQPCPECERTRLERANEEAREWWNNLPVHHQAKEPAEHED